ncbi:MAG TPA: type 1 glutamine amidotransferase [Nocardioidaceae bacterium]|nr:type 1 glutamine amidotransferase [Nocardioidaceae bacterium]
MNAAPILVVEHEAQCPPGWMGEWLTGAGCELDVRRPYLTDTLPRDLSEHRSMVILGGATDAYADAEFPWLTDVKQLVRSAVEDGTPTLGICLGLQLIAVALGGEVHANPIGQQIGVPAVGWLRAAQDDPLFGPLTGARIAVQWNNDVVRSLPATSVVLAQTAQREIQAVRFAPAMWGVQWHPEAGVEIISRWAENDRDHALERGVDVDEYVARVAAAGEELRASWQGLATGFAALSRQTVPAW